MDVNVNEHGHLAATVFVYEYVLSGFDVAGMKVLVGNVFIFFFVTYLFSDFLESRAMK